MAAYPLIIEKTVRVSFLRHTFVMADDIAYITVKDITQPIQRFRCDRLPVFHAMQGMCRYPLNMDQVIFRNSLFE